jgi:PAS domain S-box-containing protein
MINHAKDGTPYWVEVEIQPVYNAAGVLTNFVAIENDITQRRTDQRRLAESASHFKALFEDSPVPALIQGPDDRLTHANRALARMLGTTPESLIGRDPNEFTHPDDTGPANQLRRYFERKVGETIEFERRYVRADGAVLWARVHCVRLAPAGVDPYVVAVVENFTDIKAKEHALREARDAAEAASRAKSQFLANMSHEIRTPMNGVLGMTELLLGTPLNDRQKRFAEAVYRSGEALLDIINDILDLSKIEAGRLELDASDFSVRSLVEDVFELLAPRAHQKRIELAYRVAADVPAALAGDPLRVRQVLTNLVGNAIKFTERGEVVLDLGVVESDARRVRLRFAVRDTGIGIRPEAVQRLFSVFMQADQSMSRRYGGTGLGLAISKHLVELMGGVIAVDSRLGEGSTFRFEIPLARGDESAVATPSTPIARERLAGRRILVVDDNPTNRSIIDEHLRDEGMECACAENGMTALEILRAAAGAGTPFDAAIVDLKMPLMDGVTLAQRIRADERIAGIRLVMLTSLSSGTETQAAQDAGIEICLVKPARRQQLVQAIATLLSPADAADQSPVMREAGVRLAGARVLLVEDNPVNQELARAMLQEFGCGVRLAGNGREALDALSREVFDAVLMDCQMPEMDGFEAVRLFRTGNVGRPTLATPPDVAVIALTANVLRGDAERCRAAGFSDYLPKPFRQAQLAQMLSRYVRREAAATFAADPVVAPAPAVAIDTTVIERIRDMERRGAARLLARLIETYLETSERLMGELGDALEAGDAAAARQAAHTLRSSSANLGAHEFSGRCADMEHLARSGQLLAAREAWPALAEAHAHAAARLRELEAQPTVVEPAARAAA